MAAKIKIYIYIYTCSIIKHSCPALFQCSRFALDASLRFLRGWISGDLPEQGNQLWSTIGSSSLSIVSLDVSRQFQMFQCRKVIGHKL